MSEFDGLTYLEIVFDLPTGWEKQLEREARKGVNRGIGRQNDSQHTHFNTCHCVDLPTLFDEDGVLVQTATRALFRVDPSMYANEAEMVADAKSKMAIAIDKPVSAVENHVDFNVIGNQYDAQAHKTANAAEYNERV